MDMLKFPKVTYIKLSRRNLETLLSKLNRGKGASSCTLIRETDAGCLKVRAEENDEHYQGREPGPVLPADEPAL